MSKERFENLLSKHGKSAAEPAIDWNQQKLDWIEFIRQFYESIESWLEPYANRGELSYRRTSLSLREDYIGAYSVDALSIDLAGQTVVLKPIGTLLIGTKGRIDMEGVRGSRRFILADRHSTGPRMVITSHSLGGELPPKVEPPPPDWTWKIVSKDSARISYEEFSEDNFFNALMSVVNE